MIYVTAHATVCSVYIFLCLCANQPIMMQYLPILSFLYHSTRFYPHITVLLMAGDLMLIGRVSSRLQYMHLYMILKSRKRITGWYWPLLAVIFQWIWKFALWCSRNFYVTTQGVSKCFVSFSRTLYKKPLILYNWHHNKTEITVMKKVESPKNAEYL